MRKIYVTALLVCLATGAMAQNLQYYLPDSVTYNPAIPKPKDIIYHEVGEWHVTHDRLVNYMQAIAAAAPDRVSIETMGLTYENRPQVLLTITSKKNHDRIEAIRLQHLQLCDPEKSASLNINDMPIVVYIGHSIHGNESSGSNASLLSAYYLAAAQGKQIDDLLDNVVILLDPSFNPDGLQRFATWANQHKSKNLVTDQDSREFNEVWPGGRFNHYWFDLNRDWLPAVHIESQNRLKVFYNWKPNILTDHHELGRGTFFFQPGVPSRVNPLTPEKASELTEKLGKFHARFLDRIGSLYFTKENYDDFYYGKGSTFPDINGGIGILFEQVSSRGHAKATPDGIVRFPFTIRNQFVTALSTLEGAKTMRKEFLAYQRDFYKQAMTGGNQKGFVFGDKNDRAKTFLFLQMLQRHQVIVHEAGDGLKETGFEKGSSYVVSLQQPQQLMIKAIFDKQLNFKDSLFYDITSWTMPLALGLPYKEISMGAGVMGTQLATVSAPDGEIIGGKSNYAYLFEWDELNAPKALYELQSAGLVTRVATNNSEAITSKGPHKFGYGSILVPVSVQAVSAEKVFGLIQSAATNNGIKIYAIPSGMVNSGSDIGSNNFVGLTMPAVAMLTGTGVSATDAGEVWHLLDQRMNIPSSHLEIPTFNRIDLAKYTTIIMVSGSYPGLNKDKLKAWVQAGGILILEEDAIEWSVENGISSVVFKKIKNATDSISNLTYKDKSQIDGAQQLTGAIVGAEVDGSHPLAYGYRGKTISLFKSNRVFMEKSKNPYAMPVVYGNKPLQSGWISRQNMGALQNAAAVIVNTIGTGRVINIDSNPNFRGFWLGSMKLMLNAIFFGRVIDASSGRTDE